ncbi:MAG: VOC family protein [Acidobacteriaceae bacterium]|nr:VOC family protein [Acidobacteriaceae bacterium]
MPDLSASAPLGFVMRLHHVGFVVSAIENAVPGFIDSLGMSWDGAIYKDPKQKVKVTFLAAGDRCAQIELVEPVGDDSPVAKFLSRGGGQHHLCYEVDDIEHALSVFKSRKAFIVQRPCPAVAFEGRRIAWFVTREKLVIELLEKHLG